MDEDVCIESKVFVCFSVHLKFIRISIKVLSIESKIILHIEEKKNVNRNFIEQ